MIVSVLIFLGICLVIISSVGVIRFPNFYTRLHSAGITDSSGATLLLIGFALQNGFSINTVKIILLILIIWVTSSTNGYILARTYYKVTAVFASFRGYDTFGETIVVFTAALCITLILKEGKEND